MASLAKQAQHAERLFAVACAEHGATCNPSIEDDKGWDWFVEFPSKRSPHMSADMHEPPTKALVQIKSTAGKPFSKMKLTNALRFAKDPVPCFVVLCRYTKDRSGNPEIYLLHCWEKFAEDALRRARVASYEGETNLNRIEIGIKFSAENRVTGNVAEAIWMQISQIGREYENKKKNTADTIGFGDDAIAGRIRFSSEVTEDDVADMQVGLTESVAVSRLELTSNRFGIPVSRPDLDVVDARVSIRSAGVPCEVIVTSGAPRKQVRFDATMFVAGPPLAQKHWKMRVVWDWGEVIWKGGGENADFTFKWDTSKGVPLRKLSNLMRLGAMLEAGGAKLEVMKDRKRIVEGELQLIASGLGGGWRRIEQFLNSFKDAFETNASVAEFAISDFASELDNISKYLRYMDNGDLTMNADLYHVGGAKDVKTGALVYGAGVEIKGVTFWSFIVRRLRSSRAKGRALALTFGALDYRQDDLYEGTLEENSEQLGEEIDALTARENGPGIFVAQVPNIMLMPAT